MSSLIEQAAQRLAQLRAAGVEIPGEDTPTMVPPHPMARPAPVDDIADLDLDLDRVSAPAVPMPPPAAAPVSKLVEFDLPALIEAGYLVPSAPRSHMADQYRVIKRPLIANAISLDDVRVRHANLIMVTSALPGEGKSFTAINLAMSIAAELDHTVMLVDADVARPSVLKKLGLPEARGLLDLLEGKAEMSEVLMRTNIDKLTLLPSGRPHPKATELLASEAMHQLLEDMATRYPDRIIIFDSPPLLLTTESRVLATHMGQVVMVVHAGKTLQADVNNALATIETCPLRMVLLNQAR
ncbi:MAG: hypothetical protein RIQ53_1631, partial [Pseudomonadota bacterium]